MPDNGIYAILPYRYKLNKKLNKASYCYIRVRKTNV